MKTPRLVKDRLLDSESVVSTDLRVFVFGIFGYVVRGLREPIDSSPDPNLFISIK